MGGPELVIFDPSGIGIADLFGFIISLPLALFLAFWISAVKNRAVVVVGAFIGSFLSFLFILAWVGELIYDTILPGTNPGSTFFGSLFICSVGGLSFAMIADLIVARMTARDYRRPLAVEE